MATVNLGELQKRVDKKLITKRPHPTFPLLIWNYTHTCQYAKDSWDEYTMLARGLITDHEGNIVGRSFKKFFSPEEHLLYDLPSLPWDRSYSLAAKADGVLYIVTTYNGRLVTATRGSFDSDYVPVGDAILKDIQEKTHVILEPDKTYCFELISPESHIVLNYGDRRELILLTVIDTETGNEDPKDMERLRDIFPQPPTYPSDTPQDKILSLVASDGSEEGIVVHFADGQRAKIKTREYLRLSRIMTGTNTITIWEYLAVTAIREEWHDDAKWIGMQLMLDPAEVSSILQNKDVFSVLLDRVPDEFFEFIKSTVRILENRFSTIDRESDRLYATIDNDSSRKERAAKILTFPRLPKNISMNKLSGRPYHHLIWKDIRPKYGKPFITENEE